MGLNDKKMTIKVLWKMDDIEEDSETLFSSREKETRKFELFGKNPFM